MRSLKISLILLLLCFLCGCSGGKTGSDPTAAPKPSPTAAPTGETPTEEPSAEPSMEELPDPFIPYAAPPFASAVFHDCEEVDGVKLDLSATAEGYVAVSAQSEFKLKFQVIKEEITYTYNMKNDGTPSVFPLQSGDGHYIFAVMENVIDNKYAEKYSTEADVTLLDMFQPFLRPSDYVPYTENSQCVLKAKELASKSSTALEVVSSIFDYICETVTYDTEKAQSVKSGYLPIPDDTLSSGKGICFDYASLAAAMLRSQGIPTKMIFGYVAPDDLNHAWNMFYTEETGWVTVGYQVSGDSWNRLDLTFSANGADDTFIGDGTNYTDIFMY